MTRIIPSSFNNPISIALIKNKAASLGFDSCAIIRPTPPVHYPFFENWVDAGLHAGMEYLATDRSRTHRQDPTCLFQDCQSIIMVAASYPYVEADSDPGHGVIASYALGRDYHLILPDRLEALSQFLNSLAGQPIKTAAYTDSAPILERDLAWQAGLGWVGKNTCLISPKLGSFFLIAELFTDMDLEPDLPFAGVQCGSCQRCIQACPTGCIRPDRTIDSNRCIAYHTIENKGMVPVELRSLFGNRVFGCDICQSVCPWNKKSRSRETFFAQYAQTDLANLSLITGLAMNNQSFKQKYGGTPVLRAKRRGFLRNICIALGNSGLQAAVPGLAACLEGESEYIIRAHAAWALGRLKNELSTRALKHALDYELDPIVKNEIDSALA